ncbi:MAG: triple tyrosine motif-containing protein, partial [Bacteroidota bacterium]
EYRLRKKDEPDADWISIGNQNKISFSYLVPGQYVFELRISDFGKNSSRRSVPITILPPWWQTLWFRVLIVAVFLTASYSYYRFQLRNVQKRNEKLEKVVQERTVELREAHSEVLTQAEELQQQAEELSTQRDYLADSQKELARKNQLIQNSIRAAQTIQEAVLPSTQKLDSFIPEHFILYLPRDIVSGDFYWHSAVSRPKQGQQVHYLATVDCTGHGIPGAFMTLIGTTLLDKIVANAQCQSPSEITERLDEEVRTLLKQETGGNNSGMDLSLISWQSYPDNQICLTFCGAKSDLYYFKHGDPQLHKVKGDRRSLGGLKSKHTLFRNQEIILPEGSMVY